VNNADLEHEEVGGASTVQCEEEKWKSRWHEC